MDEFKLSIETIAAVGSFLSGIVMLITMIRVLLKMKYKEEVIYGKAATDKIKNIKDNLEKRSILVDSRDFEGGATTIIPKLEFEKFVYNPIIMESNLKKCKSVVRFFDKDGTGNRTVTTWYLKWSLNY